MLMKSDFFCDLCLFLSFDKIFAKYYEDLQRVHCLLCYLLDVYIHVFVHLIFLYVAHSIGLFLFCIEMLNVTGIICWKDFHFSIITLAILLKIISPYLSLFLRFLLCSIDLWAYFFTNNRVSWLWYLCSMSWNLIIWNSQLLSYLKIPWLFLFLCIFV